MISRDEMVNHALSTTRSAVHTRSTINPLLVKLPKSRIIAHLYSFVPLLSCLWNHWKASVNENINKWKQKIKNK